MHMISISLPVFSERADASLMAEVEARGDIRDGLAYLTMQEYQACLLQNSKPRVGKAVGGDCACSKRQEQLNELGRKLGIG